MPAGAGTPSYKKLSCWHVGDVWVPFAATPRPLGFRPRFGVLGKLSPE